MTLVRNRFGRRVAIVGTASALLVLGAVVPAFAATVTSFSPACGVVGTTVAITGTGFTGATNVTFNGTSAVTESFISDTSATAVVPALATTGKIEVDGPGGDTASATDFVVDTTPTAPTITSFTPTSGAIGSTVTITGTNFCGTTAVKFNNVSATTFTVNAAGTSITATVPTGATTGKISVTNTVNTATSTTDFTVVGVPTITSFTPLFGPVGKTVVITGTNLTGATAVKFNGVAAPTGTFTVNSATQITATVPTGATTGKITVTTAGGTATSTANFTVSTLHARSVTLALRKHLVARGKVSATDAFAACVSSVPVTIQRRSGGSWKNVKSTTTSASGAYKVRVRDVAGKYRARAKRVVLTSGTDICSGATSAARTNR